MERQISDIKFGYSWIMRGSSREKETLDRYFILENGFPNKFDLVRGESSTTEDGHGSGMGDLWSWTYFISLSKEEALKWRESDHNLFEFTQLWGESKKFRTSLITPLASLDPNDHPEIKSAIIGEIKNTIQKEVISKIVDNGVFHFLDLRGESPRGKVEKINQSLYDIGGIIVISGARLSSEIQDHASFCIEGYNYNNSSFLIYQGFIKDGIRYPKKKQLI